MPIFLSDIKVGTLWSRKALAKKWGYKGYQALARGVVTPAGDNKIVLFVTREKQPTSMNYRDKLEGRKLFWEGPTDHFAEDRLVASRRTNEEVHLFYRIRHHKDFEYCGRIEVASYELNAGRPSSFIFEVQQKGHKP